MHNELSEAAQVDPRWSRWQEKLIDAQARFKEEKTLFDRELFYAMQSKERLLRTIQEYFDQFRAL
jgi:hypothetical protein